MKSAAYCLFETPLGWCGMAWSETCNSEASCAINLFLLPESNANLTEMKIARISGANRVPILDIPKILASLPKRANMHLAGESQDFRDVPVDLSTVGPFVQRVCELARQIPTGQTVTYADIAKAMGRPSLARAVGRALGRNPIPLIIPCHRVMAAHGKPGGFSAYGGRATKAKLLALEGATVNLCLELGEAGN